MALPCNLLFRIEVWDDTDSYVDELIAEVAQVVVARAAFREAVKQRPGRCIVLRHGARILIRSEGAHD
jgi:hypothetical protein